MTSSNFFLFASSCVAICGAIYGTVYFLKKKECCRTDRKFHEHGSSTTKEGIPAWLETSLQDYAKQALSYSLYQISLSEELTPPALAMRQKLNLKVYVRPALMLFSAQKQARCSDEALNEFLKKYYLRETGKEMEIQINPVFTVQEMMLHMAQKKAKQLQESK